MSALHEQISLSFVAKSHTFIYWPSGTLMDGSESDTYLLSINGLDVAEHKICTDGLDSC